MISPIPCTVITGFLGAGKTTVIQHLLNNVQNKKLALIINEFGELGIDGQLIEDNCADTCCEEEIIELANGCICCTVGEDFVPAMEKLINLDTPPDHIIIETSGLALPQPLIRAFLWPDIQGRAHIDAVIMVADTPALIEGRFAQNEKQIDDIRKQDEMLDHETPLGELFYDQLISADIVILNKADCVNDSQIKRIKTQLDNKVGRSLRYYETQYGRCNPSLLLGLELGSQFDISNRLSLHEQHHDTAHHHSDHPDPNNTHNANSHDDEHEHEHDHDHNAFDSIVIPMNTPILDKNMFLNNLKKLLDNPHIYRVKGFIKINNIARPLIIQAAGKRLESYFAADNLDIKKTHYGLVFIGTANHLTHDAIATQLMPL